MTLSLRCEETGSAEARDGGGLDAEFKGDAMIRPMGVIKGHDRSPQIFG